MRGKPYFAGLITVLCLSLAPARRVAAAASTQATQTYTSTQYGYSVDFPADWKRIPDADVKKGESLVHASAPNSTVVWEAAFQAPGGIRSFHYPYVILQVMPYGNGRQLRDSEIEQAVGQMTGNNFKKATGSTGNKIVDNAISSASVGTAQYDSTNRVFYQTINMSGGPGVGQIKGLTVGHFGRSALVSVMSYDLAGKIDASKPTFTRIDSSFHFDKDSAYDPSKSSIISGAMSGAARGAIIGGICGVLVWIVLRLVRRKNAVA